MNMFDDMFYGFYEKYVGLNGLYMSVGSCIFIYPSFLFLPHIKKRLDLVKLVFKLQW